jgi:hypothetical protein
MRRSVSLFPAALLCIAAASIGGRASADPPQVIIHNVYNQDVLVTITDLNAPHGLVIANQQPLNANASLALNASLDSTGAYSLHWKVEDPDRTKTEEGNCRNTPVFACRVDLLFAP